MGYYVYGNMKVLSDAIDIIIDKIKYIFADKEERRFLKYVPRFCRNQCDMLFECRNPRRNWRCRCGCLMLNDCYEDERKKKHTITIHSYKG